VHVQFHHIFTRETARPFEDEDQGLVDQGPVFVAQPPDPVRSDFRQRPTQTACGRKRVDTRNPDNSDTRTAPAGS
jgi:hypothetical protein